MKITGIIFDMDGVLFDTEPIHAEKRRLFFNKEQLEYDEKACDGYIGLEPRAYFPKLLKKHSKKEISYLIEKYKAFQYETESMYESSIFSDTISTLQDLKRRKIKLALASSSPKYKIEKALKATKIESLFDIVVSGELFKKSKPNPEIYHYTVEEMGVEREQLIVVEDSTYGIKAAKDAGLFVIARKEKRFQINQSLADATIDTLSELKTFVGKEE